MGIGRWHYFADEEVQGLDQELVAMLDMARGHAGIPFLITSGFRSATDNAAIGSVSDSAHLTGHGVDLSCIDSVARYLMIQALLKVGFTRLGIYALHIHADNDKTKPQNVIWHSGGK